MEKRNRSLTQRSCVRMQRRRRAEVERESRATAERANMERKKRAIKRSGYCEIRQDDEQEKITTDTICHYILHPVIFSTIGNSNDFYFHSLKLRWNERNTLKDPRCQKLLRGLHLKEHEFETLDIEHLIRFKGNGWFTSSRKTDLAKIGKVAGYFLRRFACAVGKALDDNFDPEFYSSISAEYLNDLFKELKDNETIVPVIVKLELSSLSNFDASKFVCLSEDIANVLVNGKKIIIPRRVNLLEISSDFHDWAWRLLNSSSLETQQQLINDLMHDHITTKSVLQVDDENQIDSALQVTENENENAGEALCRQVAVTTSNVGCMEYIPLQAERKNHHNRICHLVERRPASSRSKKRSTKYPLQTFFMK